MNSLFLFKSTAWRNVKLSAHDWPSWWTEHSSVLAQSSSSNTSKITHFHLCSHNNFELHTISTVQNLLYSHIYSLNITYNVFPADLVMDMWSPWKSEQPKRAQYQIWTRPKHLWRAHFQAAFRERNTIILYSTKLLLPPWPKSSS